MEIMKRGRLITEDELRTDAIDLLYDTLQSYVYSEDALTVANAYREWNNEPELREMSYAELDRAFENWEPHEILDVAARNYCSNDEYFALDGEDFSTTSDEWEGVNIHDAATALIDEEFEVDITEVNDIIKDYKKTLEELERYNPWRAKCKEIVSRYTNGEVDTTDLLQLLDYLGRHEQCWEDE